MRTNRISALLHRFIRARLHLMLSYLSYGSRQDAVFRWANVITFLLFWRVACKSENGIGMGRRGCVLPFILYVIKCMCNLHASIPLRPKTSILWALWRSSCCRSSDSWNLFLLISCNPQKHVEKKLICVEFHCLVKVVFTHCGFPVFPLCLSPLGWRFDMQRRREALFSLKCQIHSRSVS